MKKKIILSTTILLLFVLVKGEDQNTIELIDTDIIYKDSIITSKNLTVRGISAGMPILDVLIKFGKNISDINYSIKYSSQMLTIEPGLEILTDKNFVKAIVITQDFKYLKGKTKEFFDLKSGVKVLYFLFMNLGEPIGLKSKEPLLGGENYEIIYPNGLSFNFLAGRLEKKSTITINLLSEMSELLDNKNVESRDTQNSSIKSSFSYSETQSSNIKSNHSSKSNPVAVQCRAYTKKGKRCKNMTTDISGYCHDHH